MVDALLQITQSLLGIWEHKLKHKYLEEFMDLKTEYYEESSKERPDMAVLDNIDFRLLILSKAVDSEIKGQATKTV